MSKTHVYYDVFNGQLTPTVQSGIDDILTKNSEGDFFVLENGISGNLDGQVASSANGFKLFYSHIIHPSLSSKGVEHYCITDHLSLFNINHDTGRGLIIGNATNKQDIHFVESLVVGDGVDTAIKFATFNKKQIEGNDKTQNFIITADANANLNTIITNKIELNDFCDDAIIGNRIIFKKRIPNSTVNQVSPATYNDECIYYAPLAPGSTTKKTYHLATIEEVQEAIQNLGTVFNYKGSVATWNELTGKGNLKSGDVYNVTEKVEFVKDGVKHEYPAGTNFIWTGNNWDPLGGNTDPYATDVELNAVKNRVSAIENDYVKLSNTDQVVDGVKTMKQGIKISNNGNTKSIHLKYNSVEECLDFIFD